MIITEHRVCDQVKPDAVWRLWADVSNWPQWDEEVAHAQLDGPFKQGVSGKLKPTHGPEVVFTLTSVKENESFVSTTKLPGARLVFYHWIERADKGICVRQKIEVVGWLSFFWGWMFGKSMRKGLPRAMNNLTKRARGLS